MSTPLEHNQHWTTELLRFNLKFPFMQVIETLMLAVVFVMNYSLNPRFVATLKNSPPFSIYVANIPEIVAMFIGFGIGFGLYVLPLLPLVYRKILTKGFIAVVLVYLFARPIWASFTNRDLVAAAFVATVLDVTAILILIIYCAPAVFGVYGLWSRKFVFVGVSVLFIVLIAFANQNPATDIPSLVVFSLFLLGYLELGHAVTRFDGLSRSIDLTTSERYPVHAEQYNSLLNRYLLSYVLFLTVLAIVMTFIFNFPGILQALGSPQLGESLELTSIYGTVITMFTVLIFVALVGLLVRFVREHESVRGWLVRIGRKFVEIMAK